MAARETVFNVLACKSNELMPHSSSTKPLRKYLFDLGPGLLQGGGCVKSLGLESELYLMTARPGREHVAGCVVAEPGQHCAHSTRHYSVSVSIIIYVSDDLSVYV